MGEQTLVSPCTNAPRTCGVRELPQLSGGIDFGRLYQMHKRRVYSLCWHMVRNDADAEDLVQEVFIQVFRKISTFRGDAAFTTWLHRVAVNVVLMRLRRKSHPELSSAQEAEPEGKAGCLPERLADPHARLDGTVEGVDLERAIAQLPTGFRVAVVLHDIEGYGHREIAGMLGVAEGTSKSQLHKARLRLRDLLNGFGGCLPAKKRRRTSVRADCTRLPVDTLSHRPLVLTPQGGRLANAAAIDLAGALQREESEFSEEVRYGKVKCA